MVYQGYERREILANSIEMVSRTNVIRTLISLVTIRDDDERSKCHENATDGAIAIN